jgi:flagellar hook protein FlgE
LGSISQSFGQGSFETTGNTTDLAIGGDGFFVVRESGSQQIYYTRAGNFRYNKEGYLVNPEGYVVQGWELDDNGEDSGSVSDIRLASFTSSPETSTKISIITNLDSSETSNTDDLWTAWDGTSATPMADTSYEYQTTVKVYDSLGSTHDVTVYFDKGDVNNQWEYIITCNPDEDMRSDAIIAGSPRQGAGLLARGSMTFSTSSGTLTNVTLARYPANSTAAMFNNVSLAANWDVQTTAADLSSDGYFTFTPEFITGVPLTVKFDPGSSYDGSAWSNEALTTTQFSKASTTTYQAANGYGAGDLQNVDVDVDGVMTGVYSNGQLIALNRVALAKFIDIQGLNKEGGNLFRETRKSGEAITNHPGTNGLGSISPNSLEQSNVDIAAEFVKMITNQRGFQANSKIISTVDQMLSETIQMKR